MGQAKQRSVGHAQQPRWPAVGALFALACAAAMYQCGADRGSTAPEPVTYAPFAAVRVYRPHGPPRHLALLISGDGGWGAGMDAIARDLTAEDTLVAGIDGAEFLGIAARSAGACASPGEQLARLGQYLVTFYQLPAGTRPLLIGHSAGATLAYVALAQQPAGTYAGLLTLSFCTDLDLTRTLCPAGPLQGSSIRSGTRLRPGGALPAPWLALHGTDDRVCAARVDRAFLDGVPGARFVGIAGVDYNYRDRSRWWPAFIDAYRQLADQPAGTAPR